MSRLSAVSASTKMSSEEIELQQIEKARQLKQQNIELHQKYFDKII